MSLRRPEPLQRLVELSAPALLTGRRDFARVAGRGGRGDPGRCGRRGSPPACARRGRADEDVGLPSGRMACMACPDRDERGTSSISRRMLSIRILPVLCIARLAASLAAMTRAGPSVTDLARTRAVEDAALGRRAGGGRGCFRHHPSSDGYHHRPRNTSCPRENALSPARRSRQNALAPCSGDTGKETA
jgi:hypothetical protein